MDAFGDSLARRLALFREGFFQRLSPDERQIVLASADATTEQMRHQRHVEAGEIAPDFNLTDQHGRLVRLSEQVTYGPVILLFVRGSWCPFSALALRSYQDALTAIHETGSSLLAITPELPHRCSTIAERDLLAFPTLSDPDGAVTEAFGVTYEVPAALRPLYVRWGQDLPRLNKSGTWRIPFPATFVIGMDGRVALADLPLTVYARREPASVIELLESMQIPA